MPLTISSSARCLACGYPLHSLESDRCPECGQTFDGEDPWTMKGVPRPMGVADRKILEPMLRLKRWTFITLPLILCASAWMPETWEVPLYLLATAYLGMGVPYLIRTIRRVRVVRRYNQPAELLRVDNPAVRQVRRAFAITAVLVLLRVPFFFALLVSQPFLESLANHVWAGIPATSPPPSGPLVAGLFIIADIDARPTGVSFVLPFGSTLNYGKPPEESSCRPRRASLLHWGLWTW